jgi:hypothetical protein
LLIVDRKTTMPILSNSPAVVAVAAVVLIAYAVYRRSIKRRSIERRTHDLGAELRAEEGSLRAMLEALPAQIDLAKRSRTAPAPGNTEGLQQWLGELELDSSEVELLRSQLSTLDSGDLPLSDVDAEIKLVEVLALSLRASALAEKYRASIPERKTDLRETDRETFADRETFTDDEMFADDAAALRREASQYSANDSRSPIVESVV